jgi:hypothetical protein
MSVIDPIKLHHDQELDGDLARVMARAAYQFELGEWRRKWREAEAAGEYEYLDYLDRQYEKIGLP